MRPEPRSHTSWGRTRNFPGPKRLAVLRVALLKTCREIQPTCRWSSRCPPPGPVPMWLADARSHAEGSVLWRVREGV